MSDLIVKPHPTEEGVFVLQQELVYRGARDAFRIPSGFQTDFASVPRALWWLLPPYGKHTVAAVVHDWLYRVAPLVVVEGDGIHTERRLTRAEADGIFRRIMREFGVKAWRRWTMWAGVRLAGWASWGRARRLERR